MSDEKKRRDDYIHEEYTRQIELLNRYKKALRTHSDLANQDTNTLNSDDYLMKARDDYIHNETMQRLKFSNRYNEKPRSIEGDEEEEKRLISAGINTFISYDDLTKIAKNGVEFFFPPTSTDDIACLSCGDGNFYKGALPDIRNQLQTALKADPENTKISTGLARINQEFLSKPHLEISEKESDISHEDELTTPSPFLTTPKIKPY